MGNPRIQDLRCRGWYDFRVFLIGFPDCSVPVPCTPGMFADITGENRRLMNSDPGFLRVWSKAQDSGPAPWGGL